MGTQRPLPKKGDSPQYLAHVYCGQTARWIKIPRGTEVGLNPGDIVLGCIRWEPSSSPKRSTALQFSVHDYCGQTAGWMDEDATWYGSRPRPRPHCVRRGRSFPRESGTAARSFRLMSIVATVAHLSYCWALVQFGEYIVYGGIRSAIRTKFVEFLGSYYGSFIFMIWGLLPNR